MQGSKRSFFPLFPNNNNVEFCNEDYCLEIMVVKKNDRSDHRIVRNLCTFSQFRKKQITLPPLLFSDSSGVLLVGRHSLSSSGAGRSEEWLSGLLCPSRLSMEKLLLQFLVSFAFEHKSILINQSSHRHRDIERVFFESKQSKL